MARISKAFCVVTLGALAALSGCEKSPARAASAASPLAVHSKSVPSFDEPSARVPNAIVVDFVDGTTHEQVEAVDAKYGVDLEFNSVEGLEDGITLATEVEDVDATLEALRHDPEVEFAEPLMTFTASFTPNDPEYAKQWNLQMIHMPQAWDISRGKGVVVAVIDTGVAYEDRDDFRQVPDLKGVKFVAGYNFVDDSDHANDDHFHGTHVAGTIAQATDNGEGVAGVAFEASIMPIKVLNHFGSGNSADISDAIRWAADHGANVINMSLGGGGHSRVMESAVAYARKKGVTVVAAAGNTAFGRVEYPAAYPGVIAVGAVGPSGARAPYSSYGKQLDLMAPGGDKRQGPSGGILQNTIDRKDVGKSVYEPLQGTSMAAPHVAAVAALLISAGAKTPDEVEQALYAGAHAVGGEAWSEEYGHGLLDAERSLKSLKGALEAEAAPVTPRQEAPAPLETNWGPLFLGSGMLAAVLLTLRRRARPGFLNVLFQPGFLVPFVLSTVGIIFLSRWLGNLSDYAIPIPDWQKIIWGRGRLANPLFYSALLPAGVSLIAIKVKSMRPVVAGLAFGFAGFLGYAVISGAPGLSWLPFTFLARPWLILNTGVALLIARAMLQKDSP